MRTNSNLIATYMRKIKGTSGDVSATNGIASTAKKKMNEQNEALIASMPGESSLMPTITSAQAKAILNPTTTSTKKKSAKDDVTVYSNDTANNSGAEYDIPEPRKRSSADEEEASENEKETLLTKIGKAIGAAGVVNQENTLGELEANSNTAKETVKNVLNVGNNVLDKAWNARNAARDAVNKSTAKEKTIVNSVSAYEDKLLDKAKTEGLTDAETVYAYRAKNNWIEESNVNRKAYNDVQKAVAKGTEAQLVNSGVYDQDTLDKAYYYYKLNKYVPITQRASDTVAGVLNNLAGSAIMGLETLPKAAKDMTNHEHAKAFVDYLGAAQEYAQNANEGNLYGNASLEQNYPYSQTSNVLSAKKSLDDNSTPLDKDTSLGYALYNRGQQFTQQSQMGETGLQKGVHGALTSAAENLALASVNPATVLPVLSLQGAGDSLAQSYERGDSAGLSLLEGGLKFGAGYAINSVGVSQMLDTMGVERTKETLATSIVDAMKSQKGLQMLYKTSPVLYAMVTGGMDNGVQSFAESYADKLIEETVRPGSSNIASLDALGEAAQSGVQGALGGVFSGLGGSILAGNTRNAVLDELQNAENTAPNITESVENTTPFVAENVGNSSEQYQNVESPVIPQKGYAELQYDGDNSFTVRQANGSSESVTGDELLAKYPNADLNDVVDWQGNKTTVEEVDARNAQERAEQQKLRDEAKAKYVEPVETVENIPTAQETVQEVDELDPLLPYDPTIPTEEELNALEEGRLENMGSRDVGLKIANAKTLRSDGAKAIKALVEEARTGNLTAKEIYDRASEIAYKIVDHADFHTYREWGYDPNTFYRWTVNLYNENGYYESLYEKTMQIIEATGIPMETPTLDVFIHENGQDNLAQEYRNDGIPLEFSIDGLTYSVKYDYEKGTYNVTTTNGQEYKNVPYDMLYETYSQSDEYKNPYIMPFLNGESVTFTVNGITFDAFYNKNTELYNVSDSNGNYRTNIPFDVVNDAYMESDEYRAMSQDVNGTENNVDETQSAFDDGSIGAAHPTYQPQELTKEVQSQTNTQKAFGNDENYTHLEYPIAQQQADAANDVAVAGTDFSIRDLLETVNRGESMEAAKAIEIQKAAKEQYDAVLANQNASAQDKFKAGRRYDKVCAAVVKLSSGYGRDLGYLGNIVKDGSAMVGTAENAVESTIDNAINNGMKDRDGKTARQKEVEQTQQAVEQAEQKADNETAAEADEIVRDAWQEKARQAKEEREIAKAQAREAERETKRHQRAIKKSIERIINARNKNNAIADRYNLANSPAERLAAKVSSTLGNAPTSQTNAVQRMIKELFRLAKESPLPNNGKAAREYTDIDMLREVLFNDSAYKDTWEQAKKLVREAYPNKYSEERIALEDYLANEQDGRNLVSNKTMRAAVMQGVLESIDLSRFSNNVTEWLSFANYENAVNDVADYLAQQTGLYDDSMDFSLEAEVIRQEKVKELHDDVADLLWTLSGKTLEKYTSNVQRVQDAAIRDALKNIDSIREIVAMAEEQQQEVSKYLEVFIRNKYGLTGVDASDLADTIYRRYGEMRHNEIAKALRAKFPEMSGKSRNAKAIKTAFDNFMDIVHMGVYDNADVKQLVAAKYGIPGLTAEQANRVKQLGDEMAKIDSGSKEYAELKDEVTSIMADAMGGGSWADTMAGYPYVSMLSSILKTGGKNVLGNVSMGIMGRINNAITKPIIEATVGKKIGADKRSSAMQGLSKTEKQAIRQAAYRDYVEHAYTLVSGAGKYDTTGATNNTFNAGSTNDIVSSAKSKRQVYKKMPLIGDLVQTWADAENRTYGTQDEIGALGTAEVFSLLPENSKIRQWAETQMNKAYTNAENGKIGLSGLQSNYIDAMARAMDANGIVSYEQLMENPELAAKLRNEAVKQAKEVTFHDDNIFSDAVAGASRKLGVVGRAVMPFAKTPTNVVVRAAEYSPIGLVAGTAYNAYNGDANGIVDSLSKGLTGSAIMALGMAAQSLGYITVTLDNDKKGLDDKNVHGKQKYSLQIGKLLNDIGFDVDPNSSISLDALSPAILPFLAGSCIAATESDNVLEKVASGMLSYADPVINMTFLSGIAELIDSVRNAQDTTEAVGNLALSTASSDVSQFVPTIIKQIGRALYKNRLSTYSDKQTRTGRALDYAWQKNTNWLLGGEEYVDQWGRTQENVGGNVLGRLAYNMLSPTYYQKGQETPFDDALDLLYQNTNDQNVYPGMATSYATTNVYSDDNTKESYRLSKKEMNEFAKTSGQLQYDTVEYLTSSNVWDNLSDDAKLETLSDVYKFARQQGYIETLGDDKYAGSVDEKAQTVYDDGGIEALADYYATKNNVSDYTNKAGSKTTQQKAKAIDEMSLSKSEKGEQFALSCGENSKAYNALQYGNMYAYYVMQFSKSGHTASESKDTVKKWINSNVPGEYRKTLYTVIKGE